MNSKRCYALSFLLVQIVVEENQQNSEKNDNTSFDLDDDDLKKFTTQCQLIHDNLELISTKNTYYLDRGDF